ncbi:hypothetical protein [Afifella marina]|uniref:DsrE/DsrF-like family protein n=1 Tax=Afifella marina DSM 2698 TaxID=1120955 RepID=A0A1G5M735_AFIMA|nr:hypothetical protein [Afifella marina]MBK1622879.1 hypothetical protein [Afifella marina DSM 2698]MBK1625874.1 hypothetical protein [Afifella marina]MBK5917696.1 hypothetical protein [Afifella marina]RAI23617.1 hypothetical protein CH311_01700 [Afifella marina DSM 2698]SCZ21017.1 hypothetical protein SAMN03080610_00208 [Afifella marina DSM 2698]
MRKILALASLVLVLATPAMAQEKPALVTVVTSPEPQTQLMAMVLTMQSVQQGAKAHVLLCGPAADIALKNAPASAMALQKPKGMSPKGLMQTILKKTDTSVDVCALYLPNKGLSEDALIDGVGVAEPPQMAERLLAENTRVLSF